MGSSVDSKNANRLKGVKYVGTLTEGQVWKFDNASGTMIPGGDTSSTNLSTTQTTTTVDVVSDTGTDATLPQAIASGNAGVMSGADKAKLDGIEANATADQSDAEIKTAYENNANTNEFSDSEKSKLAGLESSKFLGEYVSLAALNIAHPTPNPVGSYANVDAGVGSDVERYAWDVTDDAFILQLGVSTLLTDAQIKTQYENNANTNAYTDTEKTKVGHISVTQAVDLDTLESDTATNNAKVSNVTTDLSEGASTTTTVNVDSSDGTNATLQPASTLRAGVMSKAKFDEVEVNNAKVSDINHNVTTDLSIGTKTGTTLDVNSSDGTNATIPSATITEAGLMSAADKVILNNVSDDQTASEVTYSNATSGLTATDVQAAIDEVEGRVDTNDAKVSNVTTDLSIGTKTSTTVDVNSSDGTNATVPSFNSTEAGLAPASGGGTTNFLRADGTWTSAGGVTNLGVANVTSTNLDVTSDTGTDATLPTATVSDAGVMSAAKFNEVVANNAKVTNVTTDLSTIYAATEITVISSDGTDAVINDATGSVAGVMSATDKTKSDFITVTQAVDLDTIESDTATNNAKVSNVSTNLSTTLSATEVTVESSDGIDVAIPSATASLAGILTAAKFNEIVANTAKISNVSTDLSIGTKTASSVDVNSSDGTNATVPSFNATEAGLTPASTGGIIKFLRADGTWTDIFSTINLSSFLTYLGANNMRQHQEVIGGVGRVTWEGTTGGLFTIIDDKDNELWTASDVSGNPIGYIDADWNVRFGNPFNRPFSIRHDGTTGIDYTKFVLPDYANDAAADADAALLSGESYTTSAVDRNIKIKP